MVLVNSVVRKSMMFGILIVEIPFLVAQSCSVSLAVKFLVFLM